jgi:hypothetical protein
MPTEVGEPAVFPVISCTANAIRSVKMTCNQWNDEMSVFIDEFLWA